MNESTLVPRKEMSYLDWLARNVHVWPYELQTHCYVMAGSGGKKEISASAYSPFFSKFTKEQWLARRAELQNKPSWEDAPEWAEWLAQDGDGEWIWYVSKPFVDEENDNAVWEFGDSFDHELCQFGEVLGNWRDTLEKRPEQDEFDTFTSIEDNQDQKMKRDDGWFERGDLPPVGIAVQLWHGGTYAYDCELISKRGNNFVLWNLTWDRPDSADCMMCVFKPTPTERDVLLEMLADFDGSPASAGAVADAILAAGFSLGAK